ncbi:universal stress protein [Staphylococcus nepalensis]|uniref:universal stress protein n=1 Tax=Staphylococcus nepalensis TaxID=214473 RepID=UPI0022700CD9|nr:universal stress protein [Staphylococcus nepalensis]MCY1039633.1 universal stress protein [Staphylococcus nepalensis]
MYENILLAYDCEEKFETAIKELNKLISNKRDETTEEGTLITVLVIIPQQLLEKSVAYQNKHFKKIVMEEKRKFKPFLEDLEICGFRYETKYICGNVKKEVLNELKRKDYDLIVLSNRNTKFKTKDALGNASYKISKNTDVPTLIIR